MLDKISLHDVIPEIKNYLLSLQKQICTAIEAEDGQATFQEDEWQHGSGGGGKTRVLTDGKIIEKAGVNFSHVYGQSLPKAATDKRPDLADCRFQALGLSLVIHPLNPFVPTTHANIRFIAVEKADGTAHWWFGGGFDLTPYYGFTEDCMHWHTIAKEACEPFGSDVYPRYKKWCDEYFYLKHRNEPRGIGGIFFDDLNEWGFEKSFAFMRSIGDHFIKAYRPILQRRKSLSYSLAQRDFQCYRRGRYVEFNLIYDRGTIFGLQSGGRTESILMSLPAVVHWKYDWKPELGTQEEALYRDFLVPKEWI